MSRVSKIAEVEGEKCCLSFTEFNSRSGKSKRMRLDGDAAKKSREVFVNVLFWIIFLKGNYQ